MKICKTHPDAIIPTYGTEGAACFDLYAVACEKETFVHSSVIFRTGLSFEIPEGYAMLVFSRSGHGFKNDIRLANGVGIIDADYRGEVMVKLTNDNRDPNGNQWDAGHADWRVTIAELKSANVPIANIIKYYGGSFH